MTLACATAALAAAPADAITVTTTADRRDSSPDGVCDADPSTAVSCSLSEAITEANATPAADTIRFRIPDPSRAAVQTITPTTGLPALLGHVTIDGYTQPGATENTASKGTNAKPLIEIDGRNLTEIVTLAMTGEGNVVRGLVINDGVLPVAVLGTNNALGGSFIGTDPTGLQAVAPEQFDVYVGGADGTLGGPEKADRNLISASPIAGVDIAGADVSSALIQNNLIGTDRTGVAGLGNGFAGVIVRATAATGVAEIVGNTIAFNGAAPGLGRGRRPDPLRERAVCVPARHPDPKQLDLRQRRPRDRPQPGRSERQ